MFDVRIPKPRHRDAPRADMRAQNEIAPSAKNLAK
jgi:hypothetical protein